MTEKSKPFEIRFMPHKGEVVLSFPESYQWIALPPKLAREVAANLIKMADDIEAFEPAKQC